ncbi:MAG: class I SAM-dependent methyltransferase [Deltaproteobacteria bacterium]|nr:class I SAM-dependent methyltransferase [Deltaproteobacteria bacterium]
MSCFQQLALQADIYDRKEAAGQLLSPQLAPRLGRFPDLLLTYREHARQARKMKLQPGARVLELGCSTGTFLRSLQREYGVEAHGVDVSQRSVSHARRLCPSGYWYRASATALPFHDRSFDAVLAFDVLEHVGDYASVLRALARLLRPGGRVLLHVPVADIAGSCDALWQRYRSERYQAEQIEAGHFSENLASKSELLAACAGAGLQVEGARRFNVMFQNLFDYRSRHRVLGRLFNGWRLPFALYHSLVAPVVELFTVVPDRALAGALDIGASLYVHARRCG